MPWAVMALVAVVDAATGPDIGLLPLVSLGPAFAGLAGGWRRTALIGTVALVLGCALGMYDGLFAERRGYAALGAVAGVTAAGVVAAVTRRRREAELAGVRSIAEAAQRVLLRPVPRSAGPLRIAVSYTSAVAEARIGGDLYEVAAVGDKVRVIVGDVQGKGLEAVETAAVVLGAFREAAHDEPDLVAVGARIERTCERALQDEKFVTALLAEIDSTGTVTFVNYGHPPPLLLSADGTVSFPEPRSYALPLGLTAHAATGPQPFRVPFAAGDQMLLYTDGVTEARDETGAFYPLGGRTHHLKDPDPEAALEKLRENLVLHTQGPLHDDAAMLLLRHREQRAG
ncbi:PP2C family protein-serine/threonine phosphatase [Streptomyces sp. NPDC048111]|uniref:PP2C family protein-serine/threonine phosphatase n=1 Tax=Streptomyces sp. NPDC048111 TaxID=3365500 RepID=UPI00371398BF